MTLESLAMIDKVAARSTQDGDCWIWTGAKTTDGYGQMRSPGSGPPVYIHRASWEAHRGPIPPELVIDHECHNRLCWNPAHLNPVPRERNSRRKHWSAVDPLGEVTACRAGHPKTPEFVRVERNGRRACRECECQRYRAKKKDAG